MTSYYKCSCGYTTKNHEYAYFHTHVKWTCNAVEHPSAFGDLGGLIVMIKHGNNSEIIKWYDTEEKLMATYEDVTYRYSPICDKEYNIIMTKAVNRGIDITRDASALFVRNDSADKLFDESNVSTITEYMNSLTIA